MTYMRSVAQYSAITPKLMLQQRNLLPRQELCVETSVLEGFPRSKKIWPAHTGWPHAREKLASPIAVQDRATRSLSSMWARTSLQRLPRTSLVLRDMRARLFLRRSCGWPGVLRADLCLPARDRFRRLARNHLPATVLGASCHNSSAHFLDLPSAIAAAEGMADRHAIYLQSRRGAPERFLNLWRGRR